MYFIAPPHRFRGKTPQSPAGVCSLCLSAGFAVGRLLHPGAAELPDDPGQRGEGQNPASAQEV